MVLGDTVVVIGGVVLYILVLVMIDELEPVVVVAVAVVVEAPVVIVVVVIAVAVVVVVEVIGAILFVTLLLLKLCNALGVPAVSVRNRFAVFTFV